MKDSEEWATLEYVEFIEKIVKDTENKNESSNRFNLGIFYGLIFGILGNLFITLLFDYKLKELSGDWKFLILIIVMIIILFFIYIVMKENKDFKNKQDRIENHLHNLDLARDKIKSGKKVNILDLIDSRNIVEKAMDEHQNSQQK